jgi:hypothetical protein
LLSTITSYVVDFFQGYDTYITVLYMLGAAIVLCIAVTAWVAILFRKDDSTGPWMKRYEAHNFSTPIALPNCDC